MCAFPVSQTACCGPYVLYRLTALNKLDQVPVWSSYISLTISWVYMTELQLCFSVKVLNRCMLGVKGKCVVDRRCVLLCEGDTLYTDANGREYLKRVRNVRPTWNLTVTQPESGNYYPLTAGAYIQVHNPTPKPPSSPTLAPFYWLGPNRSSNYPYVSV